LEAISKYAKYYAIAGTVCFLISIEMNLMITLGYLKLPFATVSFFSIAGVLIGLYLLLLSRYSVEARNHGIIVLLLNIFAFILGFLVMFGASLGIALGILGYFVGFSPLGK